MARAFQSHSDGYTAWLTQPERLIMAQVAGDAAQILGFRPEDADAEGAGDAVDFDPARELLAQALSGLDEETVRPTDPALLALLPDASADSEVATEFRHLTQNDLSGQKLNRLVAFARKLLDADPYADSLEHMPFDVARQDAEELAAVLTDLRLVLAARLKIESDLDSRQLYDEVAEAFSPEQHENSDDEQRYEMLEPEVRELFGAVFLLLGHLQESLVDCMLEELGSGETGLTGSGDEEG